MLTLCLAATQPTSSRIPIETFGACTGGSGGSRLTLWQGALLGLLQGLTEFLPVSSSGHLVVMRWALGIHPPGALVETALHVGTLAAVVAVYLPQIARLVRSLKSQRDTSGWRMLGALTLGSLPAAAVGLLARRAIESRFNDPASAAWGLLGTTCLLLSLALLPGRMGRAGTDSRPLRPERFRAPSTLASLTVGFFQALALLPGVSRSGATIVAGRWTGLSPEDSAAFSFLLSVPAVVGAAILEGGQYSGGHATVVTPLWLLVSATVAAVTGYVALRAVLRLVAGGRLWLFAPYTLVIAMVTLVMLRLR